MIILNPFEPWPGELCLEAAARHDVRVITRVVDYGGLFWGDVEAGMELAEGDHRAFRPDGWIEAGLEKLERVIPIAEREELKPIQLACQWNLAHPAVECVVPTLIQEAGPAALPIEEKRAQLAALPEQRLSEADVSPRSGRSATTPGCMALKGASPGHEGEERPDRWAARRRPRRGRCSAGGSTPTAISPAPPPERVLRIDERTRPWWTLAGACAGLFILMLDSTVVALALPSIHHDLGASAESLQWVMNSYLLTIAVLVVTAGRLGDMFGRKRAFLIGIVVFGAGSILAGAAQSPAMLIGGRVLQGVGAAPTLTLSLAIVCNAFPPRNSRGRSGSGPRSRRSRSRSGRWPAAR